MTQRLARSSRTPGLRFPRVKSAAPDNASVAAKVKNANVALGMTVVSPGRSLPDGAAASEISVEGRNRATDCRLRDRGNRHARHRVIRHLMDCASGLGARDHDERLHTRCNRQAGPRLGAAGSTVPATRQADGWAIA